MCVGPFYKSGRHHNSALHGLLASLTAALTRLRCWGNTAQAMERRRQALPFLTRWRFQWHGGDGTGGCGDDFASWLGSLWSPQWNKFCPFWLRFWDPFQIVPMCYVQTKTKKRWPIERDHWIAICVITDHTWSHLMPKANSGHVARWVSLKVRCTGCTVQGISSFRFEPFLHNQLGFGWIR